MKQTNKHTRKRIALGLALGVSFGSSLGMVLDHLSLGVSLGMSIGLALGLAIESRKDKEFNAQLEEKGYTIKAIDENEENDEYAVTISDKYGEEVVVKVSSDQMDVEDFVVGDTVFLDEDGDIEQAFDEDDEEDAKWPRKGYVKYE